RGAHADRARIGALRAGQHAEQRGLAGTVRPDDADDAATRQAERQIVDQQPLAVALAQVLDLDDRIAEPFARRDVDLARLVALLKLARSELLVALQAGLALGLTRLGILSHPLELVLQGLAQRLALALLDCEPLLLLLEPGGVVPVPGDAVSAI